MLKIILLGKSIIEQGQWDSLLYKHDALSFGIGGDYTLGMLNRLNFVISKAPEICIVEGGINDIYINIPIDSILLNYKAIIKKLKANKIKAIIVSVTYTSINFNNSEVLNKKIKQINILLKDISNTNDCTFLDLNEHLCKNDFLLQKYTYDGIHYTAEAYTIFANEIKKIIN